MQAVHEDATVFVGLLGAFGLAAVEALVPAEFDVEPDRTNVLTQVRAVGDELVEAVEAILVQYCEIEVSNLASGMMLRIQWKPEKVFWHHVAARANPDTAR